MYLNQKNELEFKKFKNLSIEKLVDIRSQLDAELFANKFYLIGFDVPVPVQLNCVYLDQKQKNDLFSKSQVIFGAISKVVKEYYKSKQLQELIKLHPFEKELFLNSSPQKGFGIMRLDAFWDGKTFRFVELNSDFPDGIVAFQDMCDTYNSKMVELKLLDKNAVSEIDNRELLYQNIINIYKINGGKETNPTIAVVGPKDRIAANEYYIEIDFFKKKKHQSFLVEPHEISKSADGSLYYKKIKIDIIRRAAEIRYFRSQKHSEKIFEAYKTKKVIMVNGFHDRLWGIKSIFAILKDKRFQYLFDKQEIDTINETIPETFIIPEKKTNINQEKYWSQKNDYIIKPSDMSEGEGIFFGNSLTDEKWQELLLQKEHTGWLIQEVIKLEKRKVLIIKDNKKICKNLYTDLMVHTFMDKNEKIVFGNPGNRTSESPVVNVVLGGGFNEAKIIE